MRRGSSSQFRIPVLWDYLRREVHLKTSPSIAHKHYRSYRICQEDWISLYQRQDYSVCFSLKIDVMRGVRRAAVQAAVSRSRRPCRILPLCFCRQPVTIGIPFTENFCINLIGVPVNGLHGRIAVIQGSQPLVFRHGIAPGCRIVPAYSCCRGSSMYPDPWNNRSFRAGRCF